MTTLEVATRQTKPRIARINTEQAGESYESVSDAGRSAIDRVLSGDSERYLHQARQQQGE